MSENSEENEGERKNFYFCLLDFILSLSVT